MLLLADIAKYELHQCNLFALYLMSKKELDRAARGVSLRP
jgi:hypothetical protein